MRLVIVEACDYESAPVGGQLSFCKQLVEVFSPSEIVLVGIAVNKHEPIGRWFTKELNGKKFECFNLYKLSKRNKPCIPLRLRNLLAMLMYRHVITKKLGSDYFFLQSPELVLGLNLLNRQVYKQAYIFHGVSNPLKNPRYSWGKLLAELFWKTLENSLRDTEVLLAAADDEAIDHAFPLNSKLHGRIKSYPTRYDDSTFFPKTAPLSIKKLYCSFSKIVVTTGRLNEGKGWDFILDAFEKYKRKTRCEACLIFIGDGEERHKLENRVKEKGLDAYVFITGFICKDGVCDYLNIADLYIVGSQSEGWSIAMLEALACGLPIVSTKVSGASQMILNGVNGNILDERNSEKFSKLIEENLEKKKSINQFSLYVSQKYKMSNFKSSIEEYLQFER